ncbi:MAG: amidase [Ketobacteraceae bacterium]|nr:amidase [Ketobacteraceae bacterium]
MLEKPETINAYCDDALGDLDAVGIAERIRRGEISAQEAVEAAIARAEKVNPMINGITTDMYAQARERAANPWKGELSGVPTFVKDNDDVEGVPTTHGSRALSHKPARQSSPFVEQFHSLGLIALGKTTMPEFGLTGTTESTVHGATRNPWNLGHSTGGSSGGSAAMVAAGVVPIAHGNDGGGSTRIPAACCGLVGLKPTRGRLVNVEGSHLLPVNLVHQGVLTRTVRDTAVFYAGAEKHYQNRDLPDIGLVEGPGNRRLRIGFFTDGPEHYLSDSDVVSAVHEAAALCQSLGHEVEEIPYPFDVALGEDFLLYWSMLAFMFHRFGSAIYRSPLDKKRLEPLTLGLSRYFTKNMYKAPMAVKRLRNGKAIYQQAFGRFDVMLSPVLGHPPPKIGYLGPEVNFDSALERLRRFVPFTAAQNVSGGPGIALPFGKSRRQVPVGVQFFAPFGEDRRLLELAFELEQAHPWPLNRSADQSDDKGGDNAVSEQTSGVA